MRFEMVIYRRLQEVQFTDFFLFLTERSAVMNLPKIFPHCHIERVSHDCVTTTLACFPPTLDPVRSGILLMVGEYRMSDQKLVTVLKASSFGPVYFHGSQFVEIHWTERDSGEIKSEHIHWLTQDESHLVVRAREHRSREALGYFEETAIQMPRMITLSQVFHCEDRYFRSGSQAIERYEGITDGPFLITIGNDARYCFRICSRQTGDRQNYIEDYIDITNGWVVLKRVMTDDGTMQSSCSGETQEMNELWRMDCRTAYLPILLQG